MPPKSKKSTHPVSDTFSSDHFLRSINLEFDAEYPERIEHFYPTTKSIRLLKSILGQEQERAFFIVAPYGSGKSLTAAYALHLIENRNISSEMLNVVGNRLGKAGKDLGEFSLKRNKSNTRGLAIPLHGYCPNFSESLKASTLQAMGRLKLGREARPLEEMPCSNIEEAITFLRRLKEIAKAKKLDRIAILWDEFGRNIEKLLREGRSSKLNEVQVLAEFASRSKNLPFVVSLLMHQGLLHYAGSAPQSVRSEWTKIEGRFKSFQYVDDSKEIYQLISDVVSNQRRSGVVTSEEIKAHVDEAIDRKLFKGFNKTELKRLIKNAYPIHPVALYLLPRISARVAQNERTLFSFLYSVDLNQKIFPCDLFDYFSNDMRVDTTPGGTYKQWLETQSALSKTGDAVASQAILKTACMLGLGILGERAKAGRSLLLYSLRGMDIGQDPVEAIDKLIEKKLLLYRRHNDVVSVWHGTDLDLRGRLTEEKNRTRNQFDLISFLIKEVPPQVWYPVEYNDDFHIRRYFTGEYKFLPEFIKYINFEGIMKDLPAHVDGEIIYLIPENRAQIKEARSIAQGKHTLNRLVFAVPEEPLPIFDVAHEIWCLQNMQTDSKLVSLDPLVSQEIQQMTDDTWGHLQRLLDRILIPGQGSYWFNQGKEIEIKNPSGLRRSLSKIMGDIYTSTPKFNNEVIIRKKPSSVMVNARKKLLMAILERSGQEDLGLEGFWPDVALYRTILLNSGLYKKQHGGRWGYASPKEIKDPGLAAVWGEFSAFFTQPEPAKSPKRLFDEITKPPFGVRAGVIPILFSAAFKAFPSAISMTRDGDYITDIIPSEIELLCREPDRYRVIVLDLKKSELAFLRKFHALFSGILNSDAPSADLIRLCYDALDTWRNQLPQAALFTEEVSSEARHFQILLRDSCDPVQLLFDEIPRILNVQQSQTEKLIQGVKKIKEELESVVLRYKQSAISSLQRVLGFVSKNHEENRGLAQQWASCFPESLVQKMNDGVAKGLITRMLIDYKEDNGLLESLSSLLVGKSFSRWEDSTVTQFDRELTDVVHRVEEVALASQETFEGNTLASAGLERLISGRMEELFERLTVVVGREKADEILSSVKNGDILKKLK